MSRGVRRIQLSWQVPTRFVRRIDDEYFPEFRGQIIMFAQIVDQLPDIHMFRHRHQIALHDPAGGFFRIGQGRLDDRAIFGIQFGQNGFLFAFLEIFNNRNGIIGLELFSQIRDLSGLKYFDQIFPDVLVHFRKHIRTDQIAQGCGQRCALVFVDQFEQIGNIGVVQRVDQFLGEIGIGLIDGI